MFPLQRWQAKMRNNRREIQVLLVVVGLLAGVMLCPAGGFLMLAGLGFPGSRTVVIVSGSMLVIGVGCLISVGIYLLKLAGRDDSPRREGQDDDEAE